MKNEKLIEQNGCVNYSEWRRQLSEKIKAKPQIRNTWRMSRFKVMYKDGLSVNEAFRCWYCAH